LWGAVEHRTAPDRWLDPETPWRVNVSLLTGPRSGVVVADVDPRHGGTLAALWERGWSPDTPTARTGGGGWHVFALCPPGGLRSMDAYAPGVELKGGGKQIILPPSLHPLHRHYEWLEGHAPWERAVAPLPESVVADVRARAGAASRRTAQGAASDPIVLTEPQLLGLARMAPYFVKRAVERARAGVDGGRRNTCFWLSCQMRDSRVSDEVGRWAILTYQQELERLHV
jgi:hypothetical protein